MAAPIPPWAPRTLVLAPGAPTVWLLALDLEPDPERLRALTAACGLDRRARAARLHRPGDRLRCLAAGWLLAEALAATGHPGAREAGEGRPTLPDLPGLMHSLAHAGAWVACALHRGPVGVDLEPPAEVRPGMAEAFMSPAELRGWLALPGGDRPDRFLDLWTLKEAYLKALGTGFGRAPEAVTLDPEAATVTDPEGPPGVDFRFARGGLPGGGRLALCWADGDIAGTLPP